MWMAKQQGEQVLGEPGAELGQVTLSGSPAGVALAGERRNVMVCLPGGYHWAPARGDTVLVVKSGVEGTPCVVGTPLEEDVPPGEVWISAAPGAGIRLKEDGSVLLQGRVEVSGSLVVNGEEMNL